MSVSVTTLEYAVVVVSGMNNVEKILNERHPSWFVFNYAVDIEFDKAVITFAREIVTTNPRSQSK